MRCLPCVLLLLLWSALADARNTTSCLDCHGQPGKPARLRDPVKEWHRSVHYARDVGCQDCHGGDANASDQQRAMSVQVGYVGVPTATQTPAFCARCHADERRMRPYNIPTDQFAQYQQSVHGQLLLGRGDSKAANCVDCHGSHEIRTPNDPRSSVFRVRVPETCGKCHADPRYMQGYTYQGKPIPTNQEREYWKSVHGVRLRDLQPGVPSCADCHGTHGAAPPEVQQVAQVCGSCHAKTEEHFRQGPHALALRRTGRPRCIDCHGQHGIRMPGDRMLQGSSFGHCGACHQPSTRADLVSVQIRQLILGTNRQINEASRSLRRAELLHMDVADGWQQLSQAQTLLTGARDAQHTATVAEVRKLLGRDSDAEKAIKQTMTLAKVAVQGVRTRRNTLLLMGAFILAVCLIVYGKWRQVTADWQTARSAR